MEVPQRRVDRVIQRLALAFGKQVRQQAVAHVVRKRTQDRAGFAIAAGAQRQSFEADHRVAAPVAEPVIAGVDGAQLAAFRLRQHVFFEAAAGQHDELIGRHRELLGERIVLELRREREQAVAARRRSASKTASASNSRRSQACVEATNTTGRSASTARAVK